MLTWNDGTYSASYTYDGLNRVLSVATVYPFGVKTVSYTYDKVGNKKTLTNAEAGITNYNYDPLNRVTQVTSPTSEVTGYQYDNAGRLIKKTLPNGAYTDYTYNNVNQLLSLINKKSDTTVISNYSYTHDKVGNRLSMTTTEGAHNYTYDSIYRLGSADHPVQTDETYTYDEVGNRLTSAVHPTWTYDANNRLTSYNGTSYTYDNNGNTISKTDDSGATTYTYDYENRLSQATSSTLQANYSYDPFGKRLSKTVNGVTTYYLYDNEDIIGEYDSAGSIVASYVHGQGIDEPIKGLIPGQGTVPEWFYTFDGLGTVSEITDSSQNVVESYKYDSFGNLQTPPATGNPYTYTSREYDNESGLYYYRARYYDAGVGRFLSEDPIEFNAGVNFYNYCYNNSINLVDPYGEQAEEACLIFTLPALAIPPGWILCAVIGTVVIGGGILYYKFSARSRGKSNPYTLPRVNPGRDCKGKCKPCPPNGPAWEYTHKDGTRSKHQIIYRQDPNTCECYPERIHL